jgi:HK97 family phage portal protein
MRLFGFDITRPSPAPTEKGLSPIGNERGGWFRVLESFSGAWQANVEVNYDSIVTNNAVYACATLIASDIAKLRVKLVEKSASGIWNETSNPAYSPVLRKPNPFQTRIQFWETYFLSKLLRGNTYVLKQRDGRGVVTAMYVLDSAPGKVKPLVSTEGAVFYELAQDNISGVESTIVVPAREIIHDRFNCIYHPLVGNSPIFAAGLAATQGIRIQNDAVSFFGNKSRPGGILTAPGAISNDIATRLKEYWDTNFSGENAGKVAVLGDGMSFAPIRMTATDAQLIEQLKWSNETVASVFHVPAYKIGVGAMPTYNNIQALNVEYYSQALQRLIEDAEVCLDEGLGLSESVGTEFDLDGLLRMDSVTQISVLKEAVGAGVMSPNEARAKVDLPPTAGGETPYLQEQNYSLAALAKRDALADPFNRAAPAPVPQAQDDEDEDEDEESDDDSSVVAANDNTERQMMAALLEIRKGLV